MNSKLGLIHSIKRHSLDIFDMLFFGLVGFISISKTRYHQRLGDIWSGCIVVDLDDESQGIRWESEN